MCECGKKMPLCVTNLLHEISFVCPCHSYSNMQLCKWTRYLAFVRLHQSKQMLPSVPQLLCPRLCPPDFFARWNPCFCSHSVRYKWLGVGVSRNSLIFIPSGDGSRQGAAARLSSPSLGHNGLSNKTGKLD